MNEHPVRALMLDAAERLLVTAQSLNEVSVRRIAKEADVNIAAVSYHFGSREKLVSAVVERIYNRLSAEQLRLLQRAIDARAPDPPDLGGVIAALIGPSVRWSFDPNSSYAAFQHHTTLVRNSRDPSLVRIFAEKVEHLRAFIAPLKRIAPWLSETDIAWRIHCAMGVRHNVLRFRERAEVMIEGAFDLNDPQVVLDRMIEVIAPMFRRP